MAFKQNNLSNTISVETQTKITFDDGCSLLFFGLYLLIDFIPQFESYNYAEPQWLYLNYLNIIVLVFLFFSKKINRRAIKTFSTNSIVLLFSGFLMLAAISFFVASNIDEYVISISRYGIGFVAFFNLYFLFKNKPQIKIWICCTISILLFVESCKGLSIFFKNIEKIDIQTIRYMMTTNHANKNIFAANILVKLPFVIFAILQTSSWRKHLHFFTFLTALLTLYFLSARAITIGLFLVISIIVVGLFYVFIKNKKSKMLLGYGSGIAVSVLMIFFLSIVIIKKNNFVIDNNGDKIRLENGAENRLKSINKNDESLKIRLHYWESSFDVIKKNPALGVGLGNWKLASMPYENTWKTNNSNGIHMHNDFLEAFAETGILGGLAFLLLFIALLFQTLKRFLIVGDAFEKTLNLIIFAAIVGYSVDSFFNFPLSQPTMSLIFVLLLAFAIKHDQIDNEQLTEIPKQNYIAPIFLLLISFATIYPNQLMFKFYKSINISKIDNVALNLSFAQVDSLFDEFPSLDDTASPVDDIKTRYLIKENKFAEALKSIEKSNKINPNSLYANSLRVEMYEKMKVYDSVFKYNKILFDAQPSYPLFFERYVMGLARKKDTAAIQKTLRDLKPEFINAKHYAFTFSYLLNAGLAPKESFKVVEKGLKIYPDDFILNDIVKDFNKMLVATGQNKNLKSSAPLDFNKALDFYLSEYKKNPSNFVNVENVGVCYYQQKKYDLAIPYLKEVVLAKAFSNGKSEYILGLCYFYKNDLKTACEFAKKAANQNYADAIQLQKISCK